ncbi:MAG: addiction module protein [Limisphaerales bacterium]
MPMTLDQVVAETRQWPPGRVAELVDRLTTELQPDAEIENAWRTETRRRVAEIESGRVEGIPGEVVSARVRQIVGR